MRIYVCYDSPSIIQYLKLMPVDVFTTHFSDCQFNEIIFPPLGGNKIVSEEQIVHIEQYVPKERT